MRSKFLVSLMTAASLVAGTAAIAPPAQAAVSVGIAIGPTRAPPPLRSERRPPRPHSGWVWQPGYWAWRNNDYAWVGGVWVQPPRGGQHWNKGHWVKRHGHWVWVDGRWH